MILLFAAAVLGSIGALATGKQTSASAAIGTVAAGAGGATAPAVASTPAAVATATAAAVATDVDSRPADSSAAADLDPLVALGLVPHPLTPAHLLVGNGSSAASDPHRLIDPASSAVGPLALPPDSTPLAAAAGTEPASMAPLTGVPAGWVSSVHRFKIGGMVRSYLMLRPKFESKALLPVVVVLHGRQLTPAAIERLSQMPAVTGPAIQVYPAGYGRSWNAGACCGVAHTAGINDVAFLTATIRQVLATQHDAAVDRVYLVGYSNGGRMAYRMACADPGTWAGVAAVEAVPVATCASTTPVPLIVIASSRDPLLTIANGQPRKTMRGYLQPTVQTTVAEWRQLDGCAPAGTVSLTGVATVQTWSKCVGAGRVAYALYHGGSHAWPAGREGAAGTPSAEDLLWVWLQRSAIVTAAAA